MGILLIGLAAPKTGPENTLSNPGLDAARSLRFTGWQFKRGANAKLGFVPAAGRDEVLELRGKVGWKPSWLYQQLKTIRGAKYNVHYDVLDHALGPLPKAAAAGGGWAGWENGMLLATDGQWQPPPPVHEDDEPPAGLLLAMHPASGLVLGGGAANINRTEGWRRVVGSFVARGPDTTVVLHAEPDAVAHFDHVSVAVESHNADDLPLIQTDDEAEEDSLPPVHLQPDAAAQQHARDLALLLRWFLSVVVDGRKGRSGSWYGANKLPYVLIMEDDFQLCPVSAAKIDAGLPSRLPPFISVRFLVFSAPSLRGPPALTEDRLAGAFLQGALARLVGLLK
eukprot:SAG22_NODE_4245_length_1329_cov_1.425203_1_plen_337_part_01